MALKIQNIFHRNTFQSLPKFGFLVLKMYHLATLVCSHETHFGAVNKKELVFKKVLLSRSQI
jgi:hypothetical protein